MSTTSWRALHVLALVIASAGGLSATTIPRLSFEQLIDQSEVIASGRVTDSWAAWDPERKYIWTHYRLSVTEVVRGTGVSTLEFAEPGGAIGDASMIVGGAIGYKTGESVVIFLSRMPNGYLRTAGWSQGKYNLDSNGRLHGAALTGAELVDAGAGRAGSSLSTLDGMSTGELKQRVAARVRATAGRVQ
jgi:hypothetical protein